MEPVESGHQREPDEASIAAPPRPHASDWLWHPWYAKLWGSAVPVYWIGAAASVKIEALAGFYDTAFAGYCNMLFFPMTALVILSVGFVRARLEQLGFDYNDPNGDEFDRTGRAYGDPPPSLVNWLPWSVLKISVLPNRARASLRAATQKPASMVFDNRQASTLRLAQSMTATRYRKPFRIGMYVTSARQTWLGRSIASLRSK